MLIHADRFSFQVTDKTTVSGFSGDVASGEDRASLEEVLVAFVAVETTDESDPHGVAEQAASQILTTADKVGTARVMVYPYAHLSSDLAKPRVAADALDEITDLLCGDGGFEVHRAPFGYYKSYDIACKGHPLSELAMTLTPGGADREERGAAPPDSKAIAAEKTLRSEWRVYQPDGSYILADNFDFESNQGLRDLFAYERSGSRVAEDAPPHIKLMREHELVDYEPASDAGNLRWYPQGLQIREIMASDPYYHATPGVTVVAVREWRPVVGAVGQGSSHHGLE